MAHRKDRKALSYPIPPSDDCYGLKKYRSLNERQQEIINERTKAMMEHKRFFECGAFCKANFKTPGQFDEENPICMDCLVQTMVLATEITILLHPEWHGEDCVSPAVDMSREEVQKLKRILMNRDENNELAVTDDEYYAGLRLLKDAYEITSKRKTGVPNKFFYPSPPKPQEKHAKKNLKRRKPWMQ